jgi:predicted adenine nucleotide alpha hydrolase (AANH) superfamily ATPase
MPEVLLYACCAPCAIVPLARLRERYSVRVFFFAPNIHPASEYRRRREEMARLCREEGVELIEGPYRPADWGRAVRAWRHRPEGSERCRACFGLRLGETARRARELGMAAFAATLSVARQKNTRMVNDVGRACAAQAGVPFLDEDWKKGGGADRAVALSRERGFYRQNYCGCALSRSERVRKEGAA